MSYQLEKMIIHLEEENAKLRAENADLFEELQRKLNAESRNDRDNNALDKYRLEVELRKLFRALPKIAT